MSKPNYTPRADSLAAQVIGFLTNHDGITLTLDEVVEQFDCTRGNIHTLLLPARDAGLLKRDKNEDGEYVYSTGYSAGGSTRKTPATIQDVFLKPANTIATGPLPDPATVQIEDGVPIPGIRGRSRTDWTALLSRLKPGQSCKLPYSAKHTLANAVTEAHKTSKHKFTMRTLSATRELRIWRVE